MILRLLICCLLALPALAENSDVVIVPKDATLPNETVQASDVRRLQPFLDALPEGYSARIHFVTITPSGEPLRYAEIITPLNPEGQPHGIELEYANWYQAPIRQTPYVNGQRHGTETHYRLVGGKPVKITEIPWQHDQVSGARKTWHLNGQLQSETPYVDGKAHGTSRSWSPGGELARIATFVTGQRHGQVTDYWPDEAQTVKRVITYDMGAVDGESKAFYQSGQLKWLRTFHDNDLHGPERHYGPDGELERERWWLHGEQVDQATFQQQAP